MLKPVNARGLDDTCVPISSLDLCSAFDLAEEDFLLNRLTRNEVLMSLKTLIREWLQVKYYYFVSFATTPFCMGRMLRQFKDPTWVPFSLTFWCYQKETVPP